MTENVDIIPIEQLHETIKQDTTTDAIALINSLLDQIKVRDTLIQKMSNYAATGNTPDLAGKLEAIETAIRVLAGGMKSTQTELLVIKAWLAAKDDKDYQQWQVGDSVVWDGYPNSRVMEIIDIDRKTGIVRFLFGQIENWTHYSNLLRVGRLKSEVRHNLAVGDRVRVNTSVPLFAGRVGTLVAINDGDYTVQFSENERAVYDLDMLRKVME